MTSRGKLLAVLALAQIICLALYVALLPHAFVVAPSVPAQTVREFIAYAKANPGKLNYGAPLGTPPQMLTTLLKVKADIDVVFIPYRGAAPAIQDLMAGQIDLMFDQMSSALQYARGGKIKAYAVAAEARRAAAPEIPTAADSSNLQYG